MEEKERKVTEESFRLKCEQLTSDLQVPLHSQEDFRDNSRSKEIKEEQPLESKNIEELIKEINNESDKSEEITLIENRTENKNLKQLIFPKILSSIYDQQQQQPSTSTTSYYSPLNYFENKEDIDAAAEMFASVFPNREPKDVLKEHGINDLELVFDEEEEESEGEEGEEIESLSESIIFPNGEEPESPIPIDPCQRSSQELENDKSRWKRVLRTALPLQAMLVLLLGAACLVPHCDDDYCCHLLNNFARSFEPQIDFTNGPPPF
ncbi:hypothetical protein Mgra_00006039 [Meloidogyne graminicola]|uniref:KASH domain-containing protein n=1 Tax=Meloidogyne graminicola TaxID=189291 RepID=A0A8S9ZMH7_9BILA|nr:hypothetical protein Mgra_00006039 [Meloidogyne graminicola]